MAFSQESVTENFMDQEITDNWKINNNNRRSFERNYSFTRYNSFGNSLGNFSERIPFGIPSQPKPDALFTSQNSIGSSVFPKCDFPQYLSESSECFPGNTKLSQEEIDRIHGEKSEFNEKKENGIYLKDNQKDYEATSVEKEEDNEEVGVKVEEVDSLEDDYLKAPEDEKIPSMCEEIKANGFQNESIRMIRNYLNPIFFENEEKHQLNEKDLKLAIRNIKLNFGTGLIQFIDFKKERAIKKNDLKLAKKFSQLIDWLRVHQGNFRSFDGWRELYKDGQFGEQLRRMACIFFSKSYSRNYINCARITAEYKSLYKTKIKSFLLGARNPDKFTPHNF